MGSIATSKTMELHIEGGQTMVDNEVMVGATATVLTNSGELWSMDDARPVNLSPVIRPDGVASGLEIAPAASGGDNLSDVSAGWYWLGGVKRQHAGYTDLGLTRGVELKSSVTIDSSFDITAVNGVSGAGGGYSAARGVSGGPPYIPVGSLELNQFQSDSGTAAAITIGELRSLANTHREVSSFPAWQVFPMGTEEYNANIKFQIVPMLNHTGDVRKAVYSTTYTPVFVQVPIAKNFAPVDTATAIATEEWYKNIVTGDESDSITQSTYTQKLDNGVDDPLIKDWKGHFLMLKFYPVSTEPEMHILTQGRVQVSRTFTVGTSLQAAVIITPHSASLNKTA